jgi:hypothetical protein
MPGNEPTTERNLDRYGAPQIEWAHARDLVAGDLTQVPASGGSERYTHWVTTTNPDGSPHVMPLGVIGVDGELTIAGGRTR